MEPEPIDVRHLGRERVICCGRVGDVLIDPGPESAMGTLIEALDDVDLEARNESLSLIADWAPQSLGITHFGAVGDVFETWPPSAIGSPRGRRWPASWTARRTRRTSGERSRRPRMPTRRPP
jgi:hypothetical protein